MTMWKKVCMGVMTLVCLVSILGTASACMPATEYKITYVMNVPNNADVTYAEGESNPDSYSAVLSPILLKSPKCEGYVFRGWFESEEYLPDERVTSIKVGEHGDKTLYAKWDEKSSTGGDKEDPDAPINPIAPEWSDRLSYMWRGFMPYVDEFDEAYYSDDGAEVVLDSRDELVSYIEYVQYKYITKDDAPEIHLNYRFTGSQSEEIKAAYSQAYFSAYTGLAFTDLKMFINYADLAKSEATESSTDKGVYTQILPIGYKERGAKHDLSIDSVRTSMVCETSNQLFYAAMIGARPAPKTGSVAEKIYAKARKVLEKIISDDMTATERALAIYEWLVVNVSYDNSTLGAAIDQSAAETAKSSAFYLEGVFDSGRAVCDGISKAATLLLRMEGIPAVRVYGGGHAWNKVMINGFWYVFDATYGDTIIGIGGDRYTFLNHDFFLTRDDYFAEDESRDDYGKAKNYIGEEYEANYEYDYYLLNKLGSCGDVEYDYDISDQTEFSEFVKCARSIADDAGLGSGTAPYGIEFRMKDDIRYTVPSDGKLLPIGENGKYLLVYGIRSKGEVVTGI